MADFFGSRLLRWLTMPYRVGGKRGARMINLASRPFYQVADRILGGQFLEDIAEFFLNFQTMYEGFVQRARSVEALLHDRRTTFVVVSTLETAPAAGGRVLHLRAVGPQAAPRRRRPQQDAARLPPGRGGRRSRPGTGGRPRPGGAGGGRGRPRNSTRPRPGGCWPRSGESFLNFEVAAKREAELRAELGRLSAPVLRVPAFEEDIHDLRGLARLGECLFS